jgi:hypothetical protein
MRKVRRPRHTHKYERVFLGRKQDYPVWKCQLPGCSHYMPSISLIVGQESVCWRCGEVFTITKAMIDLKKPHCLRCTNSRKPRQDEEEVVQVKDVEINLDDLLRL